MKGYAFSFRKWSCLTPLVEGLGQDLVNSFATLTLCTRFMYCSQNGFTQMNRDRFLKLKLLVLERLTYKTELFS